jgi:hypothetical protein
MSIERVVVAFSGFAILLSLVLAYFVSPYWLAFAAIIGLNLSQSAFTGFCPFEYVLKKFGMEADTAPKQ